MKILVQWALSKGADWEEFNSEDWNGLYFREDPTPSVAGADSQKGWINAINVQGVVLVGDHYHIENTAADEIVVTVWSDDNRYPCYAHVWVFRSLRPDPVFWGAINTCQTHTLFAVEGSPRWVSHGNSQCNLLPYRDFIPPTQNVAHGKMLGDGLLKEHKEKQSPRGWREWTEEVPESDISAEGKLLDQRSRGKYPVPDGTKTVYAYNGNRATGLHSANSELNFSPTSSTASTNTDTVPKGKDVITHVFTSDVGFPDSDAWPTGTYRWQIDVFSAGADLTFGLLTLGGSDGHFARVDTSLSSHLQTKTQTDGAYTGSGLHLAVTGSVSWTAGNASDRWEVALACDNPSKDAQNLTLQLKEADDYSDGPWTSNLTAVAPTVSATASSPAAAVSKESALSCAAPTTSATASSPAADVSKEMAVVAPTVSATASSPAAAVSKESALSCAAPTTSATASSPVAAVDRESALSCAAPTTSATAASVTAANVVNTALNIVAPTTSATASSPAADVVNTALSCAAPTTSATASSPAAEVLKEGGADLSCDAATSSAAAAVFTVAGVVNTALNIVAPTTSATASSPAADVVNTALSCAAATASATASSIAATITNTALSCVAAVRGVIPTAEADSIAAAASLGSALSCAAATASATASSIAPASYLIPWIGIDLPATVNTDVTNSSTATGSILSNQTIITEVTASEEVLTELVKEATIITELTKAVVI